MGESQKERSDRIRETCTRAQARADSSTSPGKYMVKFEDQLEVLFNGREGEVLDAVPKWQDPVSLAAEIEALSAYRAVQHWGTDWGLFNPKRSHYFRKHRQGA